MCQRRESCLRYTIPPLKKWQPWILLKVAVVDINKCQFYWNEEDGKQSTGNEEHCQESDGQAEKASNTSRQNKVPKKRKTQ